MPTHHRAPNNTPGPAQPASTHTIPSAALNHHGDRLPHHHSPSLVPGANRRLPSRSLTCHPPMQQRPLHTCHWPCPQRWPAGRPHPTLHNRHSCLWVRGIAVRQQTTGGIVSSFVPPVSRCTDALRILYPSAPEKPPLSSPPHNRRPATFGGLRVHTLFRHPINVGT
ncbi:hypothetical protein LY76DRAFT_34014 [Colletotrichum caudatum]|nr:hypothetical protein LY76DRAFT_34014 [Colletotrichum caudatum]